MALVIDFRTARPIPQTRPEPKLRCDNCGADLWCISRSGEIRCADCDEVCPHRIHIESES